MTIVRDLQHDLIFGFNHLQQLDAVISNNPQKIYFRHPHLDFELACELIPTSTQNSVLCLTSVLGLT